MNMKIYVVDFEEVLKNFIPYHESIKTIQKEKEKFSDEVDSIKKEMESIVNQSKSLLLDEGTQMKNAARFKELQGKAIKLESEFRANIVDLQNSELEKNFKDISDVVNEWASKNDLDVVLNKTQILYVSDKYDATDIIIGILKDRSLYQEYDEESLVSQ